MPKMDITIRSDCATMRVPRARMAELVRFVDRAERAGWAEVDIAVVDSADMERYNREIMHHAGSTDVISFDLSGPEGRAASLVVCGQVAAEQGPRHGNGPQIELLLYVTHGLLHTLGYDDQTPADAELMRARQEQLLAEFRGR